MRISFFVVAAALVVAPNGLAVELFWNDNAGIHRIQPNDPTEPLLFDTFETRGIAVDAAGGRLLWSDILPLGGPLPGGMIRSGSTLGGAVADVVRELTSPAGVALDSTRGKIYWTDLGDTEYPSAIFWADLDGSNVRRLISDVWLSEITGIAVDSQHASLYFTFVNPLIDSLYNGGVARADLDGSNVEEIVGGLVKPLGIAVDSQGGNIYWAHARGLSGEIDGAIEVANLDGQNQWTLLGGLEMPFGVALDVAKQDIYWTDMASGKIQRTVMSGILPFIEDVVTGLDSPTAIATMAAALSADFDTDGDVDSDDLKTWRSGFGRTEGATHDAGDADADGDVDGNDFLIWQREFEASSIHPANTAIPEPASIVLLFTFASLTLARCCRSHQVPRSTVT
ncbi:MAG: hypothetical protein JW829_07645 [Pirellulales bacterium]|nr:hypothetical protein [Pirellulales bacterium]